MPLHISAFWAVIFLPGKIFRKSLSRACKRGVHIKVILAGPSDVMVAKHAERYMYRWLFKNNIEVYEYQPNILHGKIAACDSKWITIGSYNVNNISAYASMELNLDIHNECFAREVEKTIDSIILNDCIRVPEQIFNSQNHFFLNLWQKLCYELIRVLFYLFTFYFKQRTTVAGHASSMLSKQ